jgi:hypothetical protein
MSQRHLRFAHRGIIVPPPLTTLYDTSIGTGVSSNGHADLPLRAGARRFYVANGGSNGSLADAQNPSTPAALPSYVLQNFVEDSRADQILAAEGSSFAEGIGALNGKRGADPQFPTVIQSYDPTDNANESKYGRPTTGHTRPKFTGTDYNWGGGGGAYPDQPAGYMALRGLDLDAGGVNVGISIIPSGYGSNDYFLFENCLLRRGSIALDQNTSPTGPATRVIVRCCAFKNGWGFHGSGMYIDNVHGVTLEDNVFWHQGFDEFKTREDPEAIGGLQECSDAVFRHAYYLQGNCTGLLVRRNVTIDQSTDGGQNRGDTQDIYENLYIGCPTSIPLGGGADYNIYNPTGVDFNCHHNALLGGNNISNAGPRGIGIITANGRNGSASVHHNLLARSLNPAGVNAYSFSNEARFDQPSYAEFHDNVSYLWNNAGQTHIDMGGGYPGQIHSNYHDNWWSEATGGGNFNVSGLTMPNAMTEAALYAAYGFADRNAFALYMCEHPESYIQRDMRAALFAGYGVPV